MLTIVALSFLQIYTIGAGSPADTRAIQTRLAWQIMKLKLHRRQALELYPQRERDTATACVSTFLNMD